MVDVKNVGDGQNVGDYGSQKRSHVFHVMIAHKLKCGNSSSQLEFKLKGNRPGMLDVLIFVSTNNIKMNNWRRWFKSSIFRC